jgi:tetratricopeptide (TPR) repeat protein
MRRLGQVLLATAALGLSVHATEADDLIKAGQAAETAQDSRRALELFQQADRLRPNDSLILQKIARQYSDLVVDQPDNEGKKQYAQTALDYSLRAVAIDPRNPVNVLSLAVCHGKLAIYSDNRTKVQYSRLVREEAERALALDPNYAWAHHVLGRWHYEVASLNGASRFFVGVLYGGLPDASVEEGIRHLRLATELEPGELNHFLDLGFAYAVAKQPALARVQWERGLAMPSRGKHDEPAKQRAREALARLD